MNYKNNPCKEILMPTNENISYGFISKSSVYAFAKPAVTNSLTKNYTKVLENVLNDLLIKNAELSQYDIKRSFIYYHIVFYY